LPLYNIQKRQTLDRLSARYRLEARKVFRKQSEGLVRDFRDSLDAGARSFHPDLSGLVVQIEDVCIAHRDKVIHVAVSDGIQEVTPGKDYRLGLWQAFPASVSIEDTLSVALASERDKIVKGIRQKTASKAPVKPRGLAADMVDAYLRNIRKAYQICARDWLAGEDSIDDVISALQVGLKKTDSAAEMIFRTETTTYFNESRHDYFANQTSVDYIELYAVTDGRISHICEERHGAVVTIAEAGLRKYMPAFHPHCRTIQRPLISVLSTDKRIIEKGLALRAAHEASWPPIAWAA
jgi:SPP1 gp7 family putative phage head morphogenesis protein